MTDATLVQIMPAYESNYFQCRPADGSQPVNWDGSIGGPFAEMARFPSQEAGEAWARKHPKLRLVSGSDRARRVYPEKYCGLWVLVFGAYAPGNLAATWDLRSRRLDLDPIANARGTLPRDVAQFPSYDAAVAWANTFPGLLFPVIDERGHSEQGHGEQMTEKRDRLKVWIVSDELKLSWFVAIGPDAKARLLWWDRAGASIRNDGQPISPNVAVFPSEDSARSWVQVHEPELELMSDVIPGNVSAQQDCPKCAGDGVVVEGEDRDLRELPPERLPLRTNGTVGPLVRVRLCACVRSKGAP